MPPLHTKIVLEKLEIPGSAGSALWIPAAKNLSAVGIKTESEDQLLVGAFLPVVAGALGRNVYINFGQRIFPNLYHVIVAPPGLRKSTTVQLVTHIARSLLPKEAFIPGGFTSSQALFSEYLKHPDKLWVIDEGDVILDNWAHDAAGKGVALKILALYDCPPWVENYLKHEKKEGKAVQEVETTSTSILLGATPSSARFNALGRRRNAPAVQLLHKQAFWPLDHLADCLCLR